MGHKIWIAALASVLVFAAWVPTAGAQAKTAAPAAVTAPAAAVAPAVAKVNVNKAGAAELMALPGIGEATAAAILEYRKANGPFKSVNDLMQVKGIGEKKLAALRDLVTVE